MNSLVVGVTGGIGSGKSEVCRILRSFGAEVIAADDLARELMETDARLQKSLRKLLPTDSFLPNGKIDRRRVADLVFSDADIRQAVNEIVHSAVLDRTQELIDRFESRRAGGILVIEAALMFESGADDMVDYVIVVDAPENKRLKRATQRYGITTAEVRNRMRAQMAPAEMRTHADFVIENSEDIKNLESKVEFIFRLLTVLQINVTQSHD